ncbi:MAG: hypothetical protein ACXVLQ_10255 [Bacteriovorax sp.]
MKISVLLILLGLVCSLGVAQEAAPLFKDQKQSSTKWGEVDFKTFLSFTDWKNQSDERDLIPEWETIVRERSNREIGGRFFQCVGTCRVDRGQSFFNPSFRTSLYEGDEIQTIGESYAWIFLFDGTMVRLSPESSMTLNEINVGTKENFFNVRINAGNVLWLSRSSALFEEVNTRETDVLFHPLSLYEAQPIPDRKKYREDDLIELVEEKQTVLNQYKNLNQLIEENNKLTKGKPTYAFIVMPNMTLMGYNPSLEIVSLLGGQTFFKKRSPSFLGLSKEAHEEDVFVQMRGFENKDLTPLESDKWMMMDPQGRSFSQASENLNWLTMGEFITKRIPSLMVARELMLKKYSEFCFREKYDPKKLAVVDGYRLWGKLQSEAGSKKEDLELRLDFLKEYFRRIETTNLLVSTHFSERLKERGEGLKAMEYGNYFFIKALDKYYSYEDYTDEKETGEVLNSTTKELWKRMHGIR